MKVLCIEEGSVNIEKLTDLTRDGILVYKKDSKPPFMLDVPSIEPLNFVRELKKYTEARKDVTQYSYGNEAMSVAYKTIYDKISKYLESIQGDLNESK